MELEKHIIDTIKEWQMKIGYQEENMRLYYPEETLKVFLQMEEDIQPEKLCHLVQIYLTEKLKTVGGVRVSQHEGRFCVEVSKEANEYIATHIRPSEFLEKFLQALSTGKIEQVRKLFQTYAGEKQGHYVEEAHEDGVGVAFSFQEEEIDPYVYCVQEDEFGLTYHRFVKSDYENL